ncbi:type II toxin-antitoxin system RelE family toxin [Streptomyces millisiae]|uniref:Type II toxin-antitoxin system RelE/ParE family toxin n=1 Tax=Streptomyces millisiae TaxID=3075542 RepID=A0ABU2LXN4_9ACTN|nr:type II toxin-antitoxin system RelE/ParE family toxin [Streptomyces sp. DSM 44918]MDT0322352.1 type II toxin-antitoxin system RelE/ParE family toxin [Streptomyces sp. DSM 44918]
MTWHVPWEPSALNAAAGHLKEDPHGVDTLLRATDQLAEDPRPAGSHPWGTDHRRLRHGPWRILYRLDAEARVLHIEHVGRVSG